MHAEDIYKNGLYFLLSECYNTQDFLNFLNGEFKEKSSWLEDFVLAKLEHKNGIKRLCVYWLDVIGGKPIEKLSTCLSIEEVKILVTHYIQEKNKFTDDPVKYKLNLIKQGALLITTEDYKDNHAFVKVLDETKNNIVVVNTKEEKEKLLNMIH
ncbi:hypothetical protein KKG22_04430 [Patescibacteria group bacterium]|nr:hypothetical protein [Patescibacteria group bacterium]